MMKNKRRRFIGNRLLPDLAQERKTGISSLPRTKQAESAARQFAGGRLQANHGSLAGTGFELFRISDSGVSVAGCPLEMTRFASASSVPTRAFDEAVTTCSFQSHTSV